MARSEKRGKVERGESCLFSPPVAILKFDEGKIGLVGRMISGSRQTYGGRGYGGWSLCSL